MKKKEEDVTPLLYTQTTEVKKMDAVKEALTFSSFPQDSTNFSATEIGIIWVIARIATKNRGLLCLSIPRLAVQCRVCEKNIRKFIHFLARTEYLVLVATPCGRPWIYATTIKLWKTLGFTQPLAEVEYQLAFPLEQKHKKSCVSTQDFAFFENIG